MPKINISMQAPTNEDGQVDASQVAPRQVSGGTGNISYAPVQAGFHVALVQELKEKTYRAGYGSHKNPDSKDGKWDYYGITPVLNIPHYSQATSEKMVEVDGVQVMREATVNVIDYITVINRQDLTVGVIKGGGLYRVPQDGKSPMFRGNGGAYDLIQALALFDLDEATKTVSINTDLTDVRNRVVWCATQYEAYARRADGSWEGTTLGEIGRVSRKGDSVSLDTTNFLKWLEDEAMLEIEVSAEIAESWTTWQQSDDKVRSLKDLPIEHLYEIVDAYNKLNEDEVGSIEDGFGLRLKSVVTYWGALKQEDAEKYGFYYDADTKRVFTTEDDYHTAVGLANLGDKSQTDSVVQML